MSNSFEGEKKHYASFTFPDMEIERGEIERVVGEFFPGTEVDHAVQTFIAQAKQSTLEELTDSALARIENTDAFHIKKGDWKHVARCADAHDVSRDWELLRDRLENNEQTYAPIVLRNGTRMHLVSGNTRLMVARALGLVPVALIVDVTSL